MSIVQKESIEVIAQSVGINNLTSEAALTLAPDVEYRMRELMQEAIKCMRHSRRTVLTTDDVDTALNIRNVEPVYGFVSGDPLRFKRAIGHPDLFYVEDKEVDFKDVIEAPLPKAPLDVSIMCHWLAIEGVQPAIPENAPVEVIPVLDGKSTNKDEGLPVDIKCPVKHVLSRELQLYFDKITELTTRGSDSVLFKQALVSLATDAGLHPLVPYFTCFVADEVSRGLGDFNLLFALMRLVQSLLKNPHIHLEHYLHQLMPSVVTCLVAKRLGNRLADNHWELRDFTARIVASICKRYGHAYNNLQPRLTRTLINAFLDPKRALTQHYGAIQGLSALGSNVVLQLILPNLEPYMRLLEPELLLENQKNEMKRHEAWRVYGALLHAAGQCIYGRLKKFPVLPSSSPNNIWRKNGKVNAIPPGKRKASEEHINEQPPLKKVATDGSLLNNGSSPSDGKNEMEKDASSSKQISDVKNEMEIDASSSKQISDGKNEMETDTSNSKQISDGKNEMEIDASNSKQISYSEKPAKTKDMDMKMLAILNQVWKDDLKSGQVLRSLFDLFGERILPFIPSPETSVFL